MERYLEGLGSYAVLSDGLLWSAALGGAAFLFLMVRAFHRAKLGIIDYAALAAGVISAASSGSCMYGITEGAPTYVRLTATVTFSSLIMLGVVYASQGRMWKARIIQVLSTTTSTVAFLVIFLYAQDQARMDAELKATSATQAVQTQTAIDEADKNTESTRDLLASTQANLASAEKRLALADAALAQRTGLTNIDDRVERMRVDIDTTQAKLDCERVGTAASPGCVGFDERPVTVAGKGPNWEAANIRINGGEGNPGLRADLAALQKERAAIVAGLRAQRASADQAVSTLTTSVAALLTTKASEDQTAEDKRADLTDLSGPQANSYGTLAWLAVATLYINSTFGMWVGATQSSVIVTLSLMICLVLDMMAFDFKRKARNTAWPGLRNWFSNSVAHVWTGAGSVPQTTVIGHTLTAHGQTFTGVTIEDAQEQAAQYAAKLSAINAERALEQAAAAAVEAPVAATATAKAATATAPIETVAAASDTEQAAQTAAAAAPAAPIEQPVKSEPTTPIGTLTAALDAARASIDTATAPAPAEQKADAPDSVSFDDVAAALEDEHPLKTDEPAAAVTPKEDVAPDISDEDLEGFFGDEATAEPVAADDVESEGEELPEDAGASVEDEDEDDDDDEDPSDEGGNGPADDGGTPPVNRGSDDGSIAAAPASAMEAAAALSGDLDYGVGSGVGDTASRWKRNNAERRPGHRVSSLSTPGAAAPMPSRDVTATLSMSALALHYGNELMGKFDGNRTEAIKAGWDKARAEYSANGEIRA